VLLQVRAVFRRFSDYDEQADCIRRATVVANIHYHPDAFLETHRLEPLLARGQCVLSEPGCDPELDAMYQLRNISMATEILD